MAQHKFKADWQSNQAAPVTGALETAMAVESPARMLQQLLDERRLQVAEPQVARWSQRKALAFIAISSCTLWMALIVAGAEAVKALA